MSTFHPIIAAGFISALSKLVSAYYVHPILVNFTAALVPVSVVSDLAARFRKSEALRNAAWWTLLYAVIITPFTAIAGWLFWMPDDNGVTGMTIHKWLGTSLAVLLFGLLAWRHHLHRKQKWATVAYLIAGIVVVAALVVQGHLGGEQAFGM